MLLLYSIWVFCINSALSAITTTPGMQRKSLGETVTFQWSVTGSVSRYSVYSHTSGTLNNTNAYYTLDSQTGVVTLVIRNIQLLDAGNYTLSVTTGTNVQTDAGALLFVYGHFQSFVNQTSDGIRQLPATEGDTVELTCTVIPTSLPVAYRPKMYYTWYISWTGSTFRNISSGPAVSYFGDLVPGYSIKDDGRTLMIASAQYLDAQGICCQGVEQWSHYASSINWFYLPLKKTPDAPSNVRVEFVSHSLIAIAWNCIWFNGRPQKIFLQLKALVNNSIIDSRNTTLSSDWYNSTYTTQFTNGIQSETFYEVSVWSNNDFGSSDVVNLTVKTPKTFKFVVSPKNITFNGNQAIVNFSATDGKIAMLGITCCLELTGDCFSNSYYNVNGSQVKYDNLPKGNVYIFDFRVYGGNPNRILYCLTMVKGVRMSRIGDPEHSDGEKANPLLIPVIVLGVLFGVAVLALIGCFIAFLVCKCRQNTQPNNSQQAQQPKTQISARAPKPTTQRKNEAYEEEEDTYEAVDGIPSPNDDNYTSLEGNRYLEH